jgi:hypothetical protein
MAAAGTTDLAENNAGRPAARVVALHGPITRVPFWQRRSADPKMRAKHCKKF